MNLKGLRLFRHVVATGSLSAASDRMNLSASAASRVLTQLESDLSLTLFSRSRRNLELTEEGALLYQQISNTLDGIDEIPEIARDIRHRTRSLLSVVAAAPLANGMVVPAIARLRDQGVDLRCTVHVENRFQIESKVAARGYSMGMISLPVENEIIPIDIMPLLRSRLCVLMPEHHRLGQKREVSLSDLAAVPLVSLAVGQRWRDRLEDIMGTAGLRPDIAFETGSTTVSVEMVRNGLGLTLIDPVVMTPTSLQGLTLRPMAGDHWITYASVHAKGPRADLAEVFLDAIVSHIDDQRASNRMVAECVYLI